MRTKPRVWPGTSVHSSAGERFLPSWVYQVGIAWPSLKAGLVRAKAIRVHLLLATCVSHYLSAPSRLVLPLVVAEGLDQSLQHLGRGLEHRLQSRLVHLLDVGAEVVHRLTEALLHSTGVMERVALLCLLAHPAVSMSLHRRAVRSPLNPRSAGSHRRRRRPSQRREARPESPPRRTPFAGRRRPRVASRARRGHGARHRRA